MALTFNLKRLFKKKSNFVFLLILPIIFNLVFIYGMLDKNTYKIGVIDRDESELTQCLDDYLKEKYSLKEYDSVEKARSALLNNKIDCVLLWPEGFAESMNSENPIEVECHSVQESNISNLVKLDLDGVLKSCRVIRAESGDDNELFMVRVKQFMNEETRVVNEIMTDTGGDIENSAQSLGFLALGILFMVVTSTTIILRDKESGVFNRMIASSMPMRQYFWENFLSFFLVAAIQIFIVFVIVNKFMGIHYGGRFFRALLCTYLFSIWCISFGMLISSCFKEMTKVNTIIGFFNLLLLMLGGCLWPKSVMPGFLQLVSNFVPTGWYLSLAEKQMTLANPTAGLLEGILLLVCSLVFMHLAYRKYRFK